jgi:hypothetical protein
MHAPTRKSWSALRVIGNFLVLAITSLLIFIGWQYWLFTGGIFRTSSFNEQEWKSLNRKAADFSCYRGGMANDIKTSVLRVGQSRAEVEKLLGSPDSNKGSYYECFLGMCSGLQIDFDTLDIYFSAEGNVTNFRIVQH